jgi:hypothetical protein
MSHALCCPLYSMKIVLSVCKKNHRYVFDIHRTEVFDKYFSAVYVKRYHSCFLQTDKYYLYVHQPTLSTFASCRAGAATLGMKKRVFHHNRIQHLMS